MSTFQKIIHVFNDTHVTNAIHEKACVIFYGTDLTAQNIEFGYSSVKKKENKTKMICKYNMKKVFWRKTIFALSSHT